MARTGRLVQVPTVNMGNMYRCSINPSHQIPATGTIAWEVDSKCSDCDHGGHGTYMCIECAVFEGMTSVENILAFSKMDENGRIEVFPKVTFSGETRSEWMAGFENAKEDIPYIDIDAAENFDMRIIDVDTDIEPRKTQAWRDGYKMGYIYGICKKLIETQATRNAGSKKMSYGKIIFLWTMGFVGGASFVLLMQGVFGK